MQKANMQQLADLDFDFQMPCRYFKSSFARSLSLNNNNNNANGNGNSNGNNSLTLPKKTHTNEVKPQPQQQQQQQQLLQNSQSLSLSHSLEGDSDLEESPCATPPPALPARRHTANLIHFDTTTAAVAAAATPANQLLSPHPPQPPKSARNLNLVWPMQPPHQQPQTQQQQQQHHVQDASMLAAPSHHHQLQHHNNIHSHIYDLPQQSQQQHQHQQQQQQQQQQHQLNVEAVILQNQVDTLHWQLKQTETNCEMYRAVMEEVARFFERYQQQQQLQQIHRNGEQIARSKSLHHVHGVGNNTSLQSDARERDDDASSAGSASYLRARSSTNLMLNKSMHAMNEEHNYETIAPAGSYNAFKDFTWRRSPKKSGVNGGCKARLSSPEAAEEKLNQEAFRLARTIRNLLHTSEQQPDLTQPRHSLASIASSLPSGNHRLCKGKTSSVMTLLTPPLHNSTSIMNATLEAPSPAAKSNAELIFLRANNMRDSRLSLRSSTDSSVHSTISSTASSSSKVETDEETTTHSNSNATTTASNTAIISSNIKTSNSNKQSGGSSTEDESGFSSISSFHDVGLPLSSTLMNGTAQQRRLSMCSDSRNSTLKSGLNVLGLPIQSQSQTQTQVQVLQVQAQITASQSPSKTYRNANRYQRFSTLSNEDAAAVLWV